jgi:hypothetical protein
MSLAGSMPNSLSNEAKASGVSIGATSMDISQNKLEDSALALPLYY